MFFLTRLDGTLRPIIGPFHSSDAAWEYANHFNMEGWYITVAIPVKEVKPEDRNA